MATRTALRSAQEATNVARGSVVMGIAPAPVGDAPQQPPVVEAAPREPSNPAVEYLQALTAWIPSESIAMFLGIATFFSVYEDTTKEVTLTVVVAVLTAIYAWVAVAGAHRRRHLSAMVRTKDLRTTVVATLAFLVWWLGTPGSWLTDDADVDPFFTAIGLAVVVGLLPLITKALQIDPLSSKRPS